MNRETEISRIAYDEAIRAVAEQERSLESIRGRAATNIAIVTLTTSLLGSETVTAVELGPFPYLVLGLGGLLLLGSVALSVLVLRSRDGWVFSQSPRHILNDYLTNNSSLPTAKVYENLARFLEDTIDENEGRLKALLRKLNSAFTLTIIQVFLSILIIASASWSGDMTKSTQPQTQQPAPTQSPPKPQPSPPSNPGRRVERQDDTPLERKGR